MYTKFQKNLFKTLPIGRNGMCGQIKTEKQKANK